MGGPSPGSAPTGSGSVTPAGAPGAGDGTGALSITGTASGASVSGPRGGSALEANRRAENGRPATPAPASSLARAKGASPDRRRQPLASASSETSASGRYTSTVVPPSGGMLSVTVMPCRAARTATANKPL